MLLGRTYVLLCCLVCTLCSSMCWFSRRPDANGEEAFWRRKNIFGNLVNKRTGHTDVLIARTWMLWPFARTGHHGRSHRADMDALAIRTHCSHGRSHRADMDALAIRTRWSHGRLQNPETSGEEVWIGREYPAPPPRQPPNPPPPHQPPPPRHPTPPPRNPKNVLRSKIAQTADSTSNRAHAEMWHMQHLCERPQKP